MNIEYNNREILESNQYTHVDTPIARSTYGGKVTWADMIDFGNASLGTNYSINGTWESVLNLIQSLVERIEALENTPAPVTQYTVTFNSNGGSAVSSITREAGAAIGTLPTPSKTGYTFNGWYTASSGGSQISASTTVNANITYYAQWTINTYTVSLNVTNGSITSGASSRTVNYGGSVSWTVTPASGYEMPTSVNGASISGNTVTVSNVTSNKTISLTCTQPAPQYYFYVGTSKPTSLSQASTVTSYPAEQTYTNNSGAKAHIFVLTNSDKTVTFINLATNNPVDQTDVDSTSISGYKIFETAVGTANGGSIKIRIS